MKGAGIGKKLRGEEMEVRSLCAQELLTAKAENGPYPHAKGQVRRAKNDEIEIF